jgi:outer membrane protein assembly factor BamB
MKYIGRFIVWMFLYVVISSLLAGCGGHDAGTPAVGPGQPVSTPPSTDVSELASPADLIKSASGAGDVTVNGADFNPAWPLQHVTADGTTAFFLPVADTPPALEDLAYATYHLNLAELSPEDELLLDWATAPEAGVIWAGFSDWQHDRWVFFDTEDAARIAVPTMADYINEQGDMLVLLMLGGQDEATLNSMTAQANLLDDWNQYGHDAQHTHRSPFVGPDTAQLKWKFLTDAPVKSSPTLAEDGTVYFGGLDYYCYAVNPDGSMKWRVKPAGASNRYNTTACSRDGMVYVGDVTGVLHALNPDGSMAWHYSSGMEYSVTPTLGPPEAPGIYYQSGYVFALNLDGTERWNYQEGTFYSLEPPAVANTGAVYAIEVFSLVAFNADGELSWYYSTDNYIRTAPAVGENGTIYISNDDGVLYAITPEGSELWSFQTQNTSPSGSREFKSSPAIGADGTIYLGNQNHRFYAISSDGAVLWEFTAGNAIISSPAIDAAGKIYFGSMDGYFYALNSNGTLLWSYQTAGGIQSSPAIGADGTVYVGSGDGKLYAFGPGGGSN